MSNEIQIRVADALPTPVCPEGLEHCTGPYETVLSACRPRETDATVRCTECGACAHYVLDPEGHVLDAAELAASRKSQVESPKSEAPASAGQPAPQPRPEPVETAGQTSSPPEHAE